MSKWLLLMCLVAVAIHAQTVHKSPVDLMREGRLAEAQRILNQSDAPERYHLLIDALREPNAIEACFLYREISARFPGTDCDEFAQERLLQAAQMGIDISALVVEATPEVEPGQWPDEHPYEVERPYVAARDTQAQASPAEPEPAMSTTLDYSAVVPQEEDTGIVVSAATPAQSLVKIEPKVTQKEKIAEVSKPAGKVVVREEPLTPHDIGDAAPNGWYIQVGAFSNHANAERIGARLREDGFGVYFKPKDHLMQVRVGAYATKEEARSIGDQIAAKYNVPAVLVTVP